MALVLAMGGALGGVVALSEANPASASAPAPYRGPVPGPAGAAFYQPPNPLPAGRPGDVIWYRPGALAPTDAIAALTNPIVYEILYLSTDALGRPDAVSGTILLPRSGTRASMPVIGFASATQGMGDSCAASDELTSGFDYDAVYIGAALRKGWAVAVTDYQGLGTPGTHTYAVGRSEGPAVIDSVRAAQRLSVTGLSASSPVAFWGYSQGGGGAAWAGELQPSYAPEIHLVGIAAGGVPANMQQSAASLDGTVVFGAAAMAAIGLDAAYPELNLSGYLTPAGRSEFATINTECVGVLAMTTAFQTIASLTTSNPLTSPAWIARMRQNDLGGSPPRVPIFLYHGMSDEVLPFSQADALHRTYCRAGVNVTWEAFPGEHATTYFAGQADAMSFLVGRFAGGATRGNC